MFLNRLYYNIKPFIPRKAQLFIRRKLAGVKLKINHCKWPIDPDSYKAPPNWPGWPNKNKFALVLSHDVDTQRGHDLSLKLMRLEKELGFRSSFNFVPERYDLSTDVIKEIKANGFGIAVHGLKHDGKLFKDYSIFSKRARKINAYIDEWEATGFTAPSMICNPKWVTDLNVSHATCSFDTDPFEPVPHGISSIFPYLIKGDNGNNIVDLPYTLPQDHLLYVILKKISPDIWFKKLSWITNHNGMALLNTHPDYMSFDSSDSYNESYPVEYYTHFLEFVKQEYKNVYWNALPNEIAEYSRQYLYYF